MNNFIDVFIPGRLCLFGEHTDWAATYIHQNPSINKGYALVLGINLGIYLKARKKNNFEYKYNDKEIVINMQDLHNSHIDFDNFFEYVLATLKIINSRYEIGGAEIICTKMDLPIKKGLASSAAICMGIIRVFNNLYNLNISIEEEMELAYQSEISIGSKCGKLDQICAYGEGIRLAVFNGEDITIKEITLNNTLNYILVDLNGKKDTKKILQDLNEVYPFPKNKKDKLLFDALGKFNEEIVSRATNFLYNNSTGMLGNLMNEAQLNFDSFVAPYSDELISPKLHTLIEDLKNNPYILGIKGVGSQGDGMAQILVRNKEEQLFLANYIENLYALDCFNLDFTPENNELNAIIPIAGYGTRMKPYTNIIDKSCIPVCYNNKIYPALYLILNELDKAGILNVDLILRNEQLRIFNDFTDMIKSDINIKLSYSLQNLSGFGGAVASSNIIQNKDFSLICLGDYIYKSKEIGSCTKQLINAWRKYKKTTVSIKEISLEDTMNYGVVKGHWISENIMKIEKIVEKPTAEYAEEKLFVSAKNGNKIFGFFGQYIVKNEVLSEINKLNDHSKEIGLTEYLDELSNKEDMYAVIIDGESYDLGNPKSYYESFIEYNRG